jgi:hypothetical protein
VISGWLGSTVCGRMYNLPLCSGDGSSFIVRVMIVHKVVHVDYK